MKDAEQRRPLPPILSSVRSGVLSDRRSRPLQAPFSSQPVRGRGIRRTLTAGSNERLDTLPG